MIKKWSVIFVLTLILDMLFTNMFGDTWVNYLFSIEMVFILNWLWEHMYHKNYMGKF